MPVEDLKFGFAVVVLFAATFVRSALGFGEALVAVPLLALVMPVSVAAPVAVLVSITVATIAVAQDWREIHLRSAALLIAATLVGTPLGLWVLLALPTAVVKAALGLIIVLFAGYSLRRRDSASLEDDRSAWLFGLAAGVLGGAYGMNGPPLAIYGALRGWSPQHFRATLQGYFLPASLVAMAGYALAGLWTPPVTRTYLFALPVVLLATVLGRAINRRMSGDASPKAVYGGLVAVGTVLVWQALARVG